MIGDCKMSPWAGVAMPGEVPAFAGMTCWGAGHDGMGAGYDGMGAGHDGMGAGHDGMGCGT